jgi:hypothetical protein
MVWKCILSHSGPQYGPCSFSPWLLTSGVRTLILIFQPLPTFTILPTTSHFHGICVRIIFSTENHIFIDDEWQIENHNYRLRIRTLFRTGNNQNPKFGRLFYGRMTSLNSIRTWMLSPWKNIGSWLFKTLMEMSDIWGRIVRSGKSRDVSFTWASQFNKKSYRRHRFTKIQEFHFIFFCHALFYPWLNWYDYRLALTNIFVLVNWLSF